MGLSTYIVRKREDKILNKVFHQLAPLIALKQIPQKFQTFFIADGYTEESIKHDAELPDLVDLDNIEQDPFCRHAHSYKLELINGQLMKTDGECIERMKSIIEDARDFYLEKNLPMVRYSLAKATHYCIDSKTFPHLSPGKPWNEFHVKFEDQMGAFLAKHQEEIPPVKFVPYKDVLSDSDKIAKELWKVGQEVVNDYLTGGRVSVEVAMDVCQKCVQGIGDLWLTVAEELKLL
jgi:hypothetical protein